MKICIKRGASEIGGSCVEITADNGKRLLVDLGLPFNAGDAAANLVPEIQTDNLCGLLLSHAHGDHYGLAHYLPAHIPTYAGHNTLALIEAINTYMRKKVPLANTHPFISFQTFIVDETFHITPFPVDHSSFAAYSFLIEADGKRVFYSGDFRAHGRTKKSVEKLMENPPGNIDVLLLEGTVLGRGDEVFPSEESLEARFINVFKQTRGVAAVWSASTNIDRIVTLYKAAVRSGRELVVPPHVGLITMKTGNKNIPNFRSFKKFHKWAESPTQPHAVSPEMILDKPGKYVVFLRSPIIETMLQNGLFCPDASFTYSMWSGYKENDHTKTLLERIYRTGTHIAPDIHTSGHADVPTLKRFAEAINATRIVPIHTRAPGHYREIFGDTVEQHADNESFTV